MVYKRADSPGYRSRSRSPYRGRSRSMSRSRSRSLSPYTGGPPAGYGSRGPYRAPPPGRRSPPYRRYSRSRSPAGRMPRSRSRSRSPGSSSEEPGQIRAATKQTLQRGGGDHAQVQALKQQLEAEQVARAAAEGRVEFLKGKVREVAERSKQRGNMLAQLFAAVRKVTDAKRQLQDAERELQESLSAAAAYLQDDAPSVPAPPAPPAPPMPAAEATAPADGAAAGPSPKHTPANGHAASDAAPGPGRQEAAAPVQLHSQPEDQDHGGAAGGWVEAAPAGNAHQPPPPAGPLGNIKFKLKL
eukprot:GHUV01013901.1.p1 GENE.GHUV01013901.1~~GHUV01013901.1.p1  ORF type:complete len:300 (+),score=83.27 GHUV01013901.1:439-1338(+)